MNALERVAYVRLLLCIKAMLEAEKALRPLHPDKADELKGAAGIAEKWVEHISGGAVTV